ncbi:DUF736 family protein [Pseudomonas aeruginosa]|nr:DUF736 family protein [Pseudomonas aeruginosa]
MSAAVGNSHVAKILAALASASSLPTRLQKTEARLVLGVSHVSPAHIDQLADDFQTVLRKSLFLREAFAGLRLADPSFPATVYARLIENEDGTHDLIWSLSKPKAA